MESIGRTPLETMKMLKIFSNGLQTFNKNDFNNKEAPVKCYLLILVWKFIYDTRILVYKITRWSYIAANTIKALNVKKHMMINKTRAPHDTPVTKASFKMELRYCLEKD